MREPPMVPADAGNVTTVRQHTWSRTFPATPEQVGHARRFLSGLLGEPAAAGSPATADALACLSELVTNSVQHSRSGRPGGQFTVRATVHQGRLRAEVEDEGGPWAPRSRNDGQRGRGLMIVGCLARDWGMTGSSAHRTVWFECDQP